MAVRRLERGQQLAPDVGVDIERLALRRDETRAQRAAALAVEPELEVLHAARVDRQCAAGLGTARLDRRAHHQRHHALAVESGADRLADAPDGLLELLALALDLR